MGGGGGLGGLAVKMRRDRKTSFSGNTQAVHHIHCLPKPGRERGCRKPRLLLGSLPHAFTRKFLRNIKASYKSLMAKHIFKSKNIAHSKTVILPINKETSKIKTNFKKNANLNTILINICQGNNAVTFGVLCFFAVQKSFHLSHKIHLYYYQKTIM